MKKGENLCDYRFAPSLVRLLAISGSIHSASHCTAVLHSLQPLPPSEAALELFPLDQLPLYNADLDGDQPPASVAQLKRAIEGANDLIFCSPEYNHGIPGVLKNAIDWASRPDFASPLKGKPAHIMTASPGTAGGVRAQYQIRDALTATLTRPLVRQHIAIGPRMQDGQLADKPTLNIIQAGLQELIEEIRWIAARST